MARGNLLLFGLLPPAARFMDITLWQEQTDLRPIASASRQKLATVRQVVVAVR